MQNDCIPETTGKGEITLCEATYVLNFPTDDSTKVSKQRTIDLCSPSKWI